MKLNDLRVFLSSLPCINSGGCGIATLAMYRLLKSMAIDSKVVYMHSSYSLSSALNNLNFDAGNSAEPDAATHICLFYEGKFIDCNKEIDPSDYKYILFADEHKLLKSIKLTHKWNYEFDRESNIPEIEKFLGFKLNL